MRTPLCILVSVLSLGGCVAAQEGIGLPRAPSGPLVGTSTRVPEPHTGNEIAASRATTNAEPTNAAVCLRPEVMVTEVAPQNVSATHVSDDVITRELRVRLLSDPGLSSAARNVRIVTRNGVVTVSGDIANVRERSQIQAHARAIRGVARVDNLLRVAQ